MYYFLLYVKCPYLFEGLFRVLTNWPLITKEKRLRGEERMGAERGRRDAAFLNSLSNRFEMVY
jgi:hypothetical protein